MIRISATKLITNNTNKLEYKTMKYQEYNQTLETIKSIKKIIAVSLTASLPIFLLLL